MGNAVFQYLVYYDAGEGRLAGPGATAGLNEGLHLVRSQGAQRARNNMGPRHQLGRQLAVLLHVSHILAL